jgi:hypothetical protein
MACVCCRCSADLVCIAQTSSNNLALLAAFFNLVSIAVEAVATVSLFAVLLFLGGADYLQAFEPNQLHALAYLYWETSLCLWLIVKGVNVPKWQHQASVGRVSGASTEI